MNKMILAIVATGILITVSCSKNNDDQSTVALDNLQLDLKKSIDATNVMIGLHKNAVNDHSLCYAQENIYHDCDSLYSLHFYEYNHDIYTKHVNGAENHHMNMHGDDEGEMCGLDSIEYQSNMNATHNFHHTDSLMYQSMMSNNLVQYMSANIKACYDQMQTVRANHSSMHNLHY